MSSPVPRTQRCTRAAPLTSSCRQSSPPPRSSCTASLWRKPVPLLTLASACRMACMRRAYTSVLLELGVLLSVQGSGPLTEFCRYVWCTLSVCLFVHICVPLLESLSSPNIGWDGSMCSCSPNVHTVMSLIQVQSPPPPLTPIKNTHNC